MIALLFVVFADASIVSPSPMPARALDGPYPSLEAACAAHRPADWPDMPCHLEPPIERCTELKPMAFAGGEARVIRIAYDCMLAIRHHGRWWLQELGFVAGDRRFLGVDKMEVRGGDLIIRAQQSYWWHENDADITSWYTCAPWVMACTTAVCTAPLVYKYAARCEPESDEPSHPEWVFRNKLDIGDGWLALTPQPAHAARKLPKLWAPPQPPRPGVYRLP